MLDLARTYNLIKNSGILAKVRLISQNEKSIKLQGELDYGLFVSIADIEVLYYGDVRMLFSLGDRENSKNNKKYDDAEMDFMWMLNSYINTHNGLFIFSTFTYNGKPQIALCFNDLNVRIYH